MNFSILALSIGFVSITNFPAYADWQYTKWGESLSTVLAKDVQNIVITTDKEEHGEGKTFGLAKAKSIYETNGTMFEVLFVFMDDKLNRVSLKIDNARTATRIRSALGDQYGRPEQERMGLDRSCSTSTQIWRDTTRRNMVEFSGYDCGPGNPNDYRIIYRPILNEKNTGL